MSFSSLFYSKYCSPFSNFLQLLLPGEPEFVVFPPPLLIGGCPLLLSDTITFLKRNYYIKKLFTILIFVTLNC
jgi:hypothetical protein